MPKPLDALPLPVAVLLRRARNAKSPKDTHDTAYFAWEVSVRLLVAARPPADLRPLARGSLGEWVRVAVAGDEPLRSPPLLEAYGLATEIGAGRRHAARTVSPRKLLDVLPAYRNQVIGHGSARSADFYRDAGETLILGLEAAWETGCFLRPEARLLFTEAVEIDADGQRRARLLELSGVMSQVVDPRGTTDVPDDLLPNRVYIRERQTYRSLHPLVLYRGGELSEQVLLFNGLGRRAAFLDFAGGESLRGDALEREFAGLENELFALFSEQREAGVPEPEPDADLFGEYRILGKLGEGGMGVVYLARQESLDRLVALKMLPAQAADDATSVARFKREVAALGRCEHPNVVKILASGQAKGTLYYAMEYVEGADLAQIARVLSTSDDFDSAVSTASERVLKDRVELFAGVPGVERAAPSTPRRPRDRYRQIAESFRDASRGLHHLHEAGIVHRDVKPGNLMVTAGEHRVVLMDLGLAAIGDASRSITRDKGQILGTLRYMPPEQLQRNLLQIDHRADVYALGATFYELLTDRAFFDGDSEARLIEQILREDPVAARRANPSLPEDLSTIVGKATEKDPKLRYESAAALADDVDAYLEGRPIRAKPPTLGYLLRLAIRRNRALVATAAVGVVLLLALTIYFVSSLATERDRAVTAEGEATARADEASRERRRADARAVEASSERERAEDLAYFMLFELRDGLARIGRLDLLAGVAKKSFEYYSSLRSEGESDAELRRREVAIHNLGGVHIKQGDLVSASACYDQCLEISRLLLGRAPSNVGRQRDVTVGLIRVGDVLFYRGERELALRRYEESLEIRRRLAESQPEPMWQRDLNWIMDKLAYVYLETGDLENARRLYIESLGVARELVERDGSVADYQRGLAWSLTSLGDHIVDRGERVRAEECFREALEIRRRLVANDSTDVELQRELAGSLIRAGNTRRAAGDAAAALSHYEDAFGIYKGLVAKAPTNAQWQFDLWWMQNRLGWTLVRVADRPEAFAHLDESFEILRTLVANDGTNARWRLSLTAALEAVGDLHLREKRPKKALALFQEAAEVYRQLVAHDASKLDWQRFLSIALDRIGNALLEGGDATAALQSYRASLEIRERLVASDSANEEWTRDLSIALQKVGMTLGRQGASDDAAEMLAKATEMHSRAIELQPDLRAEHGEWEEAARRVALAGGAAEPTSVVDHRLLGEALLRRGDHAAATRHFAMALEDAAIRSDLDRGSLYRAVCAAAGMGESEQALAWLKEELRLRREKLRGVEKRLGDGVLEFDERVALEGERDTIRAHLDFARRRDPALAALRGLAAFARLFDE